MQIYKPPEESLKLGRNLDRGISYSKLTHPLSHPHPLLAVNVFVSENKPLTGDRI